MCITLFYPLPSYETLPEIMDLTSGKVLSGVLVQVKNPDHNFFKLHYLHFKVT